jgi:primosomal protein N' (replication factor Y)
MPSPTDTATATTEGDLPLLAEVALDVPGRDAYTYAVPDALADLAVGDCVGVPFGPRRLRGFVLTVDHREPPAGITLKAITDRRAGVRLPPHLMRLIAWGARYYRCSLGEFLAGAVPSPVREGTKLNPDLTVELRDRSVPGLTPRQREVLAAVPDAGIALAALFTVAKTTRGVVDKLVAAGAVAVVETGAVREVRLDVRDERHPLTDEQRVATDAVAEALRTGSGGTFMLYGVTGSGKTLVYLELAEQVIANGGQVLLLLPEIGLTPQLAARVRRRFARVAVWHSGFTDGERAELWQRCARGEVDVVVGARSALFAPLPKPGLIIVDEEHEQSFKQESVPRYHARDLAVVYAGQLRVPVLLGSATPSLESIHNGRSGRYRVLILKNRPKGGSLPVPLLVDMRQACQEAKRALQVSRELLDGLNQVKARGEQAIVLLNRRGWSPVVSCRSCGAAIECGSCAITLTYHKAVHALKCHYCGFQRPMPRACPACGQETLGTFGLGTEQLATLLGESVPGLSILRVDADTVAERQGHATLFKAFSDGAADCLVGTQMVAKGLDFPRVTLVGIVAADRGLSVPDFRSGERTWQLIAQVSGRAGRGERPGTVVVQAWDTQALPIRAALEHRSRLFVDAELKLREEYGYPPYTGLVRFLWSGPDEAKVQLAAQTHGQTITACLEGAVLLGPNPAGLGFLKGQFRWIALVKAASRGAAQSVLDRLDAAGGLKRLHDVHAAIDVDPVATS